MQTNSQSGNQSPVLTADMYRTLLQQAITKQDAATVKNVLELAIIETDRAKARLAETREVTLDKQGQFHARSLTGLRQLGEMYANCGLLPDRFNGKPDACAIGCHLAMTLRLPPMLLFPSLYIVYGTPGIEAKLQVAVLNASGKIKGRVQFELAGEGKTRRCTASAVDLEGKLHSQTVDWETAERMGWTAPKRRRSGEGTEPSMWTKIPDVMLQYRSGSWLTRLDFPDVLMGLHTVDELEDMFGASLSDGAAGGGGLSIVEPSKADADLAGTTVPVQLPSLNGGNGNGAKTVETRPLNREQTDMANSLPVSDRFQSQERDEEPVQQQQSAPAPVPSSPQLAVWLDKMNRAQTTGGIANMHAKAKADTSANWSEADLKALDAKKDERLAAVGSK